MGLGTGLYPLYILSYLSKTAYVFDARTGSCYKFHTVPRTWSRAYMACSAEGGHLTIINSDTEATVIRELFAKHPGGSMLGNFWKDVAFVGFHDWNEHGEWLTIHGKDLTLATFVFSITVSNWFVNRRDAARGRLCQVLRRRAQQRDYWRVLRRRVPLRSLWRPLVREQIRLHLWKEPRQLALWKWSLGYYWIISFSFIYK